MDGTVVMLDAPSSGRADWSRAGERASCGRRLRPASATHEMLALASGLTCSMPRSARIGLRPVWEAAPSYGHRALAPDARRHPRRGMPRANRRDRGPVEPAAGEQHRRAVDRPEPSAPSSLPRGGSQTTHQARAPARGRRRRRRWRFADRRGPRGGDWRAVGERLDSTIRRKAWRRRERAESPPRAGPAPTEERAHQPCGATYDDGRLWVDRRAGPAQGPAGSSLESAAPRVTPRVRP